MGNPILQVSEKSIRYLCTVISNTEFTDLSNLEECGAHSVLGHIIFTRESSRGAASDEKNESFSIPTNSVNLYNSYDLLFSNLNTRSSFVVFRPVFYNGFSQGVPDMVRVYVRTTAVDAAFDKRGIQALERMCAEQVFSDTFMTLSEKNKIVVETTDLLSRNMSLNVVKSLIIGTQAQAQEGGGKILVSQRPPAAQNKSDVPLRTGGIGKLSQEQKQGAESMLNTIITAGYKESQRSLAYVPWIEVSDSVIVNTRTWSLERNPLCSVPLTKIQAVSRSEYTKRFSDTLGFLLCPRGSGRRRTISACFSMLNSRAHDSEAFVSNRKRSHEAASFLSLSSCLIVCKNESLLKWKEELENSVDVLVLKEPHDLELITRERIEGTTLLLSFDLLPFLKKFGEEILDEIRESSPTLSFSFNLSDDRIKRMYVNDIIERFPQCVIPLQWIHFRCILFDDVLSTSILNLPSFKSDWTWMSHVTPDQMCFLPPQTLLHYASFFRPLDGERERRNYFGYVYEKYNGKNWDIDFLFKWRLLHGEGCVVPFVFPKAILHKVILKTQKVQVSRQENLFLSVVKSLAEQQLAGKVPIKGILKQNDYLPILLGCDALGAKGCSIDLALSRKQIFITNNSSALSKLEKNLDLHFAPPSSGTTFAQKLMGCERLRMTITTTTNELERINDKGGSKFVIESLRKSASGEAICGVCYCDPVEIFCLCGHGYCKTCTDIFSRTNTLVINCPTCRLPLCPFDWIGLPESKTDTAPAQPTAPQTQMLNFSAFGESYQASSLSYKTLSRVQSILAELNSMFKTRSKLYALSPACILAAPEGSLESLRTLLMAHSESQQYIFSIGFPPLPPYDTGSASSITASASTAVKTARVIRNPEDEEDEDSNFSASPEKDDKDKSTPPTPRSLNKLTSLLTTSFKKKLATPRIVLLAFEQLISLQVDTIELMIMGIIFATPPPSKLSRCYISATRIANLNNRGSAKNNSLNLVVLYTTEFEEDEMLIGRKVLKREDVEPKSRSHSNSIGSFTDKSPKR